MIKIQYCNSCGEWFQPRENDGHIVVKRIGYAPRYYCGACIKQNQISRKGEIANEHK